MRIMVLHDYLERKPLSCYPSDLSLEKNLSTASQADAGNRILWRHVGNVAALKQYKIYHQPELYFMHDDHGSLHLIEVCAN